MNNEQQKAREFAEILNAFADEKQLQYKNHNDSIKICFLKIKSGKMFEYDIIKSNNKYIITRFKQYQTKLDDNEGTSLYYRIIDNKL